MHVTAASRRLVKGFAANRRISSPHIAARAAVPAQHCQSSYLQKFARHILANREVGIRTQQLCGVGYCDRRRTGDKDDHIPEEYRTTELRHARN